MARFTTTGRVIGVDTTPTPQPETDTRVNPSVDQVARDALNGNLTPEQMAALSPEVKQRMVDIQIEAEKAASAAEAQAAEANANAAAARGEAGALGTSSTTVGVTGGTTPVVPGASANLTPAQAVDAAERAAGIHPNVQTNPPQVEQWVLRPKGTGVSAMKLPIGDPRFQDYRISAYADSISNFYGEYGEKVNDPTFRDWLTKRVAVLYGSDVDQVNLVTTGFNLWKAAGDFVVSNPMLKKTMTPEQWLDMQYGLAGGDAMFDKLQAEKNPITTSTETTTYTITAAQAQSLVDDLSRGLLGRMASDSERKAARRSINKLLTPTVRTTVTDATDPSNVTQSTHVNQGVTPQDAQGILEMRMRRGAEGMAFNVGKMFDEALSKMA